MGETDFGKPDAYLSLSQKTRKAEVGDELWGAMAALQVSCKGIIDRMGWKALFESYDTSNEMGEDDDIGDGELDLEEFSAIIRSECKIPEEVISDDVLTELFDEVDTDGTGGIDGQEFEVFICSDPLAMDMNYKVFAEAMFQLAQLWVEEEEEHQYSMFLDALFRRITVKNKDGTLSDLATVKTHEDRPSAIVVGLSLAQMENIKTFANEDGSIRMKGVKTKNPYLDLETNWGDSEQWSGRDRMKSHGVKTIVSPWTTPEIAHLHELVARDGPGDWKNKAIELATGRTAGMVQQKYFAEEGAETQAVESAKPAAVMRERNQTVVMAGVAAWTEEEVTRLIEVVAADGVGDWPQKAIDLGTGRNDKEVAKKYWAVSKEKGLQSATDAWLPAEDEELARISAALKISAQQLKGSMTAKERSDLMRNIAKKKGTTIEALQKELIAEQVSHPHLILT